MKGDRSTDIAHAYGTSFSFRKKQTVVRRPPTQALRKSMLEIQRSERSQTESLLSKVGSIRSNLYQSQFYYLQVNSKSLRTILNSRGLKESKKPRKNLRFLWQLSSSSIQEHALLVNSLKFLEREKVHPFISAARGCWLCAGCYQLQIQQQRKQFKQRFMEIKILHYSKSLVKDYHLLASTRQQRDIKDIVKHNALLSQTGHRLQHIPLLVQLAEYSKGQKKQNQDLIKSIYKKIQLMNKIQSYSEVITPQSARFQFSQDLLSYRAKSPFGFPSPALLKSLSVLTRLEGRRSGLSPKAGWLCRGKKLFQLEPILHQKCRTVKFIQQSKKDQIQRLTQVVLIVAHPFSVFLQDKFVLQQGLSLNLHDKFAFQQGSSCSYWTPNRQNYQQYIGLLKTSFIQMSRQVEQKAGRFQLCQIVLNLDKAGCIWVKDIVNFDPVLFNNQAIKNQVLNFTINALFGMTVCLGWSKLDLAPLPPQIIHFDLDDQLQKELSCGCAISDREQRTSALRELCLKARKARLLSRARRSLQSAFRGLEYLKASLSKKI